MSEKVNCVECRHFYGFDGVNELWTGCSIHGDFKGKKITCDHFEKKVTKEDLFKKIRKQQATITKQEKIIKEQTLRTYCQDKEIQKLLQQIKELKEK